MEDYVHSVQPDVVEPETWRFLFGSGALYAAFEAGMNYAREEINNHTTISKE